MRISAAGHGQTTDLRVHLSRRVRRDATRAKVRAVRQELAAALDATAAYAGGLPMELASRRVRRQGATKAAKLLARQAILGRTGRRIDLDAILRERRPDGLPRWTIADPTGRGSEGQVLTDGTILIGGRWRKFAALEVGRRADRKGLLPSGCPPIPAEVRPLFGARKIRRRAAWVGLLYQPEEWTVVRPDPAVVVEWTDLPGEYYALAVWGGDSARIMEFVD